MARIVISGYYGFQNTGDEAVLYSIIRALKLLEPSLEITALSHNPKHTKENFGIKAVNRWRLSAIAKAISQSDLLISGGGSLFQDVTGPKSLIYYLGIVVLARLLKKPVIIYAQGLGPLKHSWSRWLTAKVLNNVQLITLRDSESRQFLEGLGVKKPPVYVTADPVLGLKPENLDLESGKEKWEQLGLEKPVIGISVRSWPGAKSFWPILARVADDLVNKGWNILFLPFHFPSDVDACRQVARLMHNPSVILKENMDLSKIMAIIGELDFLIGMRLHALIMSAIMGVPFLALSYDPKVSSLARLTEQPLISSLTNVTYKKFSQAVEEALLCLEDNKDKVEKAVIDLRPRALDTARLVTEFLWKGIIDG
ncbi:MAG: hypothetical protein PWP31_444 [Clostridia bacterium]|nr:hypothetical protein [Clostridia bacterium]